MNYKLDYAVYIRGCFYSIFSPNQFLLQRFVLHSTQSKTLLDFEGQELDEAKNVIVLPNFEGTERHRNSKIKKGVL